jgi:DNA-3-methyladenine glycosylase II
MSLRRSTRLSLNNASDTDAAALSEVSGAKSSKKASKDAMEPKKQTKRRRESKAATSNGAAEFAVPAVPVTPNSKRQRSAPKTSSVKPPAFTPTPSAVKLIAEPEQTPPGKGAKKAARSRPAEPHATNAPLATPGGTRVVAYPDVSPVKWSSDLPKPTTTTEHLLHEACQHLISVDPRLRAVIEKHHCQMFSPEGLAEPVEPFSRLVSGICAQQVCSSSLSHFFQFLPVC